MNAPPINAKQAQLTCALEALRALDYDPPETLFETDTLLDNARDNLVFAIELLTGKALPEWPNPTDEQRVAWLEQRTYEQQQDGRR